MLKETREPCSLLCSRLKALAWLSTFAPAHRTLCPDPENLPLLQAPRPAQCGPGSRAPTHREQTSSPELEGTGVQVSSRSKESGNSPPPPMVTLRRVATVGVPLLAGCAGVTRSKSLDQLRRRAEYRTSGDHAHTLHYKASSEPRGDTVSPFPLVVTRNKIELAQGGGPSVLRGEEALGPEPVHSVGCHFLQLTHRLLGTLEPRLENPF